MSSRSTTTPSRHEQAALARTARDALHQLVVSHEPRVKKIANTFWRRNRGIEYDEVLQEANVALIYAAKCFNPDNGTSFYTYVENVVWRALKRRLESGKFIRTGPYVGVGVNGAQAQGEGGDGDGDPVTDTPTLIDELAQPDEVDREVADEIERASEILMELPFMEREAVIRRDGLLGQERRSFAVIAREMRIPRVNVVKLYKDGYERMKAMVRRGKRGRGGRRYG